MHDKEAQCCTTWALNNIENHICFMLATPKVANTKFWTFMIKQLNISKVNQVDGLYQSSWENRQIIIIFFWHINHTAAIAIL